MNTGEGLHRFVDPVDGHVYLYSQFETADCKRLFACFDQPDLKARYTLTVTAPEDWEVISNAVGRAGRERRAPLRHHRAPLHVPGRADRGPVRVVARHVLRRRRRHPARPVLPRLARAAHGRRAPVPRDQAGLRVLPQELRRAVPVRQVRPAVRAGVQRGRDGERRRRHVPRGLRLPLPGHAAGVRAARRDRAARDGAHVVRRPRHHALVGRPVAQRVVRHVRLGALPGRRHRVHRGLDDVRQRREELGLPAGPAALHPPGGGRHPRPAGRRGQLRRHHLRQGRVGAQAARRLRRPGAVPGRAAQLLHRARVGQRHVRRPARRAGAGLRPRPVRLGRAVAAHHRHQHAAAVLRHRRRRPVHPLRGRAGRGPAGRRRAAHPPDRRRHLRRRRGQAAAHHRVEVDVTGERTAGARAAGRLARQARAGQRRRPHLLRAAARPGLARHAHRPHRRHRRAAAAHPVLVGGVGDDARGRAEGPRLHRARRGRPRRRVRGRRGAAAAAAGPDGRGVLRRPASGPPSGAGRCWSTRCASGSTPRCPARTPSWPWSTRWPGARCRSRC